MNSYLLRKCRSEQQLMNELSKLLVSKDYATKKMSELLKELSFFYVSPSFTRIPHSVLKDLIALLTHLKDKKEDLRIAKLVLCFLTRIIEQFELKYHQQALASARGARSQSFDMSLSLASGLLKVIETQELNHASLPRQVACLRLYGLLCRTFASTESLILRTKPLVQKSPVWGLLTGDKKVSATITGKKEYPAQLASLAAAFHAVRFHLSYDEQSGHFMEYLLQAAFLPNAVASRHAAATLLKLFELSNNNAKLVAMHFEAFFTKFRPSSLRVGDQLATIYLLRLCGQISRLPYSDATSASTSSFGRTNACSSLLDFSFDSTAPLPAQESSPPPSPIARQRQRLDGVKVSSVLATRLKDLFLDIMCASPSPSDASPMAKAIMLATVDEAVRDANADACIMKTRANVSLFEVAAGVLFKLLRDAIQSNSTPQLHRVVGSIQLTAEALDGSVLQMTDAMEHQPQFFDKITDQVVELIAHSNPFVACQSSRALVWLLPRPAGRDLDTKWEMLMQRLLALPVRQIQPESRQFIGEAFFQRAVTNPSLHRHPVDVDMLRKCLSITLLWFQTQPCEWHAQMLIKIWSTALRKCIATMGGDVFDAINAVLDLHHHAQRATAELVKQWTLDFLVRTGAKFVIQPSADPHWFSALLLRLTKQLLLETFVSRRLAVAVLGELHAQAKASGRGDMVQQVATLVQYVAKAQPDPATGDVVQATAIHTQHAKDSLGVQQLLAKCLEPRAAVATGPATAPLSAVSSPFPSASMANAFDGMF